MPPMLITLLVHAATAAATDPEKACAGFTTVEGYGMTKSGHYWAGPAAGGAACCAKCSKDAKCNAWTYHQHGSPGSECALGTDATPVKLAKSGNVAGYRNGHSPGALPPPAPPGPKPDPEASCAATSPSPPAKAGSPSIVLFLMDDMDVMLGSWKALPKTTKLLSKNGATAKNWVIHTPVCCPSRSELVTGRYFHNIRVADPEDGGCMHVNVTGSLESTFYADWYFGPHLQQAGYTVGIFPIVVHRL